MVINSAGEVILSFCNRFIYLCFLFLLPKYQALTLIKSISGIRGTIGGKQGDGLTPLDVVKFS